MTLYLYAILERRPRPPLGRGLSGRPLASVRAGKAWVVVEHAAAQEPSPKSVLAHDRVVRRLFRSGAPLLPLRFATTTPDRETLASLLDPLADAIARAFDRVRSCVQFTLKVAGTPAPAPSAPVQGARRSGPGTRWLTKRSALGRVPEIDPLTEATRPFVRATRVERRDGAARKPVDGRFATVYHLVAREHVSAWRRAVEQSLPLLRRVSASVSGPWPPYAFAELA